MKLDLVHISKSYRDLLVMKDFSISFDENHITCILGPSGCGKTTLLHIISGLIPPDSGERNGFSGKTIGYIFQEHRLLPWKTVQGNIRFVLENKMGEKTATETVKKYLGLVDLEDYAGYYPHQLSGGMKQRVSIARAFSFPSEIILLDEPFKGLDISLKSSLMNSIRKIWSQDQRTLVYVTHDIDEALFFGHKIVVLSDKPVSILGEFIQPDEEIGKSATGMRKTELREKIHALMGL